MDASLAPQKKELLRHAKAKDWNIDHATFGEFGGLAGRGFPKKVQISLLLTFAGGHSSIKEEGPSLDSRHEYLEGFFGKPACRVWIEKENLRVNDRTISIRGNSITSALQLKPPATKGTPSRRT